jgi:hypothetical protein
MSILRDFPLYLVHLPLFRCLLRHLRFWYVAVCRLCVCVSGVPVSVTDYIYIYIIDTLFVFGMSIIQNSASISKVIIQILYCINGPENFQILHYIINFNLKCRVFCITNLSYIHSYCSVDFNYQSKDFTQIWATRSTNISQKVDYIFFCFPWNKLEKRLIFTILFLIDTKINQL